MANFRIPTVRPAVCLRWAFLLLLLALAACAAPEAPQTPQEAEPASPPSPADPNARPYRMFLKDPSEAGGRVARFLGQVLMVDYESVFGPVASLPQDELGNYFSPPVEVGGKIWSLLAPPTARGVSIVSYGQDGTVSSVTDLDGDNVVDMIDIELGDGRRIDIVTEGLGLEIFEGLVSGGFSLCDNEALRALGWSMPGCDEGGGGSSGGGAFPGGIGWGDPFGMMCSQFSSSDYLRAGLAGVSTRSNIITQYSRVTENPDTGYGMIQTTEITYDDDGNHISTVKYTVFHDQDGNVVQEVIEKVGPDGNGTVDIIKTKADGTRTTTTQALSVELDDNGDYRSDVPWPHEAPPESPPESPNQGDPGPEGDSGWLLDFCARRATYRSGVQQWLENDLGSFSVSCGAVVDAPDDENCVIFEWAGPGDVDGSTEPGSDDSCHITDDPDRFCEAATVLDRVRGNAAYYGSVEAPPIMYCNPVVCQPGFNSAEDRQAVSGEAPQQPPVVSVTPTAAVDEPAPPVDAVVMVIYTLCWRGPGPDYEVVSSLAPGVVVDVLGVGAQPGWLVIDNPKFPGVACWVWQEDVELPAEYDLSSLAVFPVPVLAVDQPDEDGGKSSGGGSPSPGAPAAPSNLNAVVTVCAGSTYNVKLTWKDNSNNESGFRIYRNGVLIATVGANTTQFVDTHPTNSTGNNYTVRAYNASGDSAGASASDLGCIF